MAAGFQPASTNIRPFQPREDRGCSNFSSSGSPYRGGPGRVGVRSSSVSLTVKFIESEQFKYLYNIMLNSFIMNAGNKIREPHMEFQTRAKSVMKIKRRRFRESWRIRGEMNHKRKDSDLHLHVPPWHSGKLPVTSANVEPTSIISPSSINHSTSFPRTKKEKEQPLLVNSR